MNVVDLIVPVVEIYLNDDVVVYHTMVTDDMSKININRSWNGISSRADQCFFQTHGEKENALNIFLREYHQKSVR